MPNVLGLHISHIQEQLKSQELLLSRLKTLSEHLLSKKEISIDEFIQTIEATIMYEKYYSEEQLKALKQRAENMGEEGMRQAQEQWTNLLDAFRNEMENETDPAHETVQALVARYQELIKAFTGGDAGIEKSLGKMYTEEGPEKASKGMVDPALFEYIGKARGAG